MKVYEGLAALLQGKYLETTRGMGGWIESVVGSIFTFRLEECRCSEHWQKHPRTDRLGWGTKDVTHSLDINDPDMHFEVKVRVFDADNEELFTVEVANPEKVRICVGGKERVELIIGAYGFRDEACQKYPWFENHKGNAEWIGDVLNEKPDHTVAV